MENILSKLSHMIAEAAKVSFDSFKAEKPNDHFYAFGLMTPDCISGDPVANTEESFAKIVEIYRKRGFTILKPGETRSEQISISTGHIRYSPDEWCIGGTGGAIAEMWKKIQQFIAMLETTFDTEVAMAGNGTQAVDFIDKMLDVMLNSMKILDASGYFGTGNEREQIAILVWVTPFLSEEWCDRMVKELNPDSVYKRIRHEAPDWF